MFAEQVYGIPPEQVIGSSVVTEFEMRTDGPVLVRRPEIGFIDDKEGKPVAINLHVGRRPLAAFGNSDGDLQMLQWTMAGDGPRFALYVHHTDDEREWAYDRASHIGRLDKGLDEAATRSRDNGTLSGLPIAHKDLTETRGIRTTYGSPIFADHEDVDIQFSAC